MIILLLFVLQLVLTLTKPTLNKYSSFPDGFDYLRNIDLSILQSPRYATPYNFIGDIIDGYKAD